MPDYPEIKNKIIQLCCKNILWN